MPGLRDFRLREQRLVEGIPLAETTWDEILQVAKRLKVATEQPVTDGSGS